MPDGQSTSSGHAPPSAEPVVIVGAGIAGLVAALQLAGRGVAVTVFERGSQAGGKLRPARLGEHAIDNGPTVLTLLDALESALAATVPDLRTALGARRADVLARHSWPDGSRLDLHADCDASAAAIGELCGSDEAAGYRRFVRDAARLHECLAQAFLATTRPSVLGLMRRTGLEGALALSRLSPFRSLWSQLGNYFRDPRLRQLFARYATYVGASPFAAPATLATIAHVERQGVWLVDGGLHRLAALLQQRACAQGVVFRFDAEVVCVVAGPRGVSAIQLGSGECVAAQRVVLAVEAAALARGQLGDAVARAAPQAAGATPSLSAVTWCLRAQTSGFPLAHHNVFFSADYAREFDQLMRRGAVPDDPTVYFCAQDRDAAGALRAGSLERLLGLVNAPALRAGRERGAPPVAQPAAVLHAMLPMLHAKHGLQLRFDPGEVVSTGPGDFAALYPGSDGALYGAALHGWRAAFQRPAARTRLPGLYRAGGSCHPGAGVPMAAISGTLAAEALWADLTSSSRLRRVAMPGGTSTRSATTADTR